MLTIARSEIEVARIRSFPNTYLNEIETGLLVTLVRSVKPKVMIEIGCQEGRTAKIVLDNVPTLQCYIGIDIPSDRKPALACQRNEVPRSAGVYASGDSRFFVLVREGGSLGLEPQDLEPCDAVFIDGDHSEYAVARDSVLARSLVRPGGILVWHDYNNPAVEVTQALDRLGWPITAIEGSWLAFLRT
jgi:predicted O-methyltransferase YrrM